jgi:hypothetical protein
MAMRTASPWQFLGTLATDGHYSGQEAVMRVAVRTASPWQFSWTLASVGHYSGLEAVLMDTIDRLYHSPHSMGARTARHYVSLLYKLRDSDYTVHTLQYITYPQCHFLTSRI